MSDGDDKTRVGKRNSMHAIPRLSEEQLAGTAATEDTISSARAESHPTTKSSGRWSIGNLRIPEAAAREVIGRRFTLYGARLHSDYFFREGDILCTLDGYDPELGVGYAYVSHADEDVITDLDSETELALHELSFQGRCFVLVIHDSNVMSMEQLVIYVDQFLHQLPRPEELRQRRS